MRIYLAVMRTGSLAGAARALATSEARINRHLASLEAALGGGLFERRANRLVATPLAEALLEPASAMARAAETMRHLARAAGRPPERLRVTATTALALFLTCHLRRLGRDCLLEILPTRQVLDPAAGQAELALRMRKPPTTGDLLVRRLGAVAVALYVHRDLLGQEPLPVIGLRDEPGSRQAAWLAAEVGPAALYLPELPLRHRAVLDGLGCTLLPCFLGDAEPGLIRLRPPPDELREDVYLLLRRDLRATPPVRGLITALVDLFRDERAALLGGEY